MIAPNNSKRISELESSDIDENDSSAYKNQKPGVSFSHKTIRNVIDNQNIKYNKPETLQVSVQPHSKFSNPIKDTKSSHKRPAPLVPSNPLDSKPLPENKIKSNIPIQPNPIKNPETPSSKRISTKKEPSFEEDKSKAYLTFQELMDENFEVLSPQWMAIRSRYNLWSP